MGVNKKYFVCERGAGGVEVGAVVSRATGCAGTAGAVVGGSAGASESRSE